MKLVLSLAAAGALLLSACATTSAAPADHATLQEAANLMVSITQHGEGADISDLEAQLNAQAAAASNDPFVLKLVAQSRRTLSDYSQSREERVRLRHAALAEIEKAITLATPDISRIVLLNGQETEIDLKDLPDLRAQYLHQVQTDR